MTRQSRPARPGSRGVGDPFGAMPVGTWLPPLLSAIGLVIVFVVTLSLLGVNLNIGTGGSPAGPDGNGQGNVDRTPAPSDVVLPEPEAAFPGSILYAKAGNIWIQTDDKVRQLTQGGDDAMPSWSPDGQYI